MPETTPTPLSIARDGRDSPEVEPLDLGARVRELRQAHGWTLVEAAERSGLARSTLSKVENGLMSPTYEALLKLANGLETTVLHLFMPPAAAQATGRMDVTETGEGLQVPTDTYEHTLMAQSLTSKRMLPYQTRVRARDMGTFDGWQRHEGEEFLYVLTGQVRLYTEFYAPVELRRGDSAYYDARMGHNVISLSEEDATILWVTSMD